MMKTFDKKEKDRLQEIIKKYNSQHLNHLVEFIPFVQERNKRQF